MDYDAATRVRTFILCLTEDKASSVDETKLKELKGLLRTSDELVTYAYGLLTDRLAANHSQVGSLAELLYYTFCVNAGIGGATYATA